MHIPSPGTPCSLSALLVLHINRSCVLHVKTLQQELSIALDALTSHKAHITDRLQQLAAAADCTRADLAATHAAVDAALASRPPTAATAVH